jgi:hypothetical protein
MITAAGKALLQICGGQAETVKPEHGKTAYSSRVSSWPAWWNVKGPSKMWSRHVDAAVQ